MPKTQLITWLTMPTTVTVSITTDNDEPTEEEVIAALKEQTSLWNPKYSSLIGWSELTNDDKQKHPFFLRDKLHENQQSNTN